MESAFFNALFSYVSTVVGLAAQIIIAAVFYLTQGLFGFFGIPV